MDGDGSTRTTGLRPHELQFLGYDCRLVPVAGTCVDLHREIAELARQVAAETRPHYEPVAEKFASLASTHIGGVTGAGALLLMGRKGWRTVSEPDTPALLIEQRHIDVDDGPAIDAARLQRVVHVADLGTETRWPQFTGDTVIRSAVRSLLCFPLYTQTHTWGALTLLADQPHALDSDAEDAGVILAIHAALTLEMLHRERHYRSALGSRDIIGQAKGVLMERFGVDATEAFAVVTRLAEESHRPVVVVAKELLESNAART